MAKPKKECKSGKCGKDFDKGACPPKKDEKGCCPSKKDAPKKDKGCCPK